MNKFDINDLVLHYGDFKAIKGINLGIEQNKILLLDHQVVVNQQF